jgi:hypothetical protein
LFGCAHKHTPVSRDRTRTRARKDMK